MEIKFNIPEMPEYGSGAKADFSQIEKQSDMTKEQAIASSIASDSTRIATEIASLGNQKRELQARIETIKANRTAAVSAKMQAYYDEWINCYEYILKRMDSLLSHLEALQYTKSRRKIRILIGCGAIAVASLAVSILIMNRR